MTEHQFRADCLKEIRAMMQPYEDPDVPLADLDWQEAQARIEAMTRDELEQVAVRLVADVRYYRAVASAAERRRVIAEQTRGIK